MRPLDSGASGQTSACGARQPGARARSPNAWPAASWASTTACRPAPPRGPSAAARKASTWSTAAPCVNGASASACARALCARGRGGWGLEASGAFRGRSEPRAPGATQARMGARPHIGACPSAAQARAPRALPPARSRRARLPAGAAASAHRVGAEHGGGHSCAGGRCAAWLPVTQARARTRRARARRGAVAAPGAAGRRQGVPVTRSCRLTGAAGGEAARMARYFKPASTGEARNNPAPPPETQWLMLKDEQHPDTHLVRHPGPRGGGAGARRGEGAGLGRRGDGSGKERFVRMHWPDRVGSGGVQGVGLAADCVPPPRAAFSPRRRPPPLQSRAQRGVETFLSRHRPLNPPPCRRVRRRAGSRLGAAPAHRARSRHPRALSRLPNGHGLVGEGV
jgi:hypothetical protein